MNREHIDTRRREKYMISKARERRAVSFSSELSRRIGSIMSIATLKVVTIPPTMTIKGAAETMSRYRFRRLPVTDPGTNRLRGIVGSSDIVELFGGGDKSRLIREKYQGNFIAAMNESVREIMVTDVVTLSTTSSIVDAMLELLSSRVGGAVILDEEESVTGIVTERDFVHLLAEKTTGMRVEEHMSDRVITTTPGTSIEDAARIMCRNSFRRLPVVSEGRLIGLLTTRMLIDFIGSSRVFAKLVRNNTEEVLRTKVEEIMSTQVPTISGDADLGEAAAMIERTGRGTVCVVSDGELAGILTERDILEAVAGGVMGEGS